ncbi:MAG: extracellular matrix regulator RemB [Deltaproteobacteria bacterium]
MYMHLGNNCVISTKNIIAILNMEELSEDVQDIIEVARLDKKLTNISDKGKEKALVICDEQVYLSPISSLTLYRRARNPFKEV